MACDAVPPFNLEKAAEENGESVSQHADPASRLEQIQSRRWSDRESTEQVEEPA